MVGKRLRFRDLQERGLIKNRQTLKNRIDKNGFPKGKLTGPNERSWTEEEVDEYYAKCPTETKTVPKSTGRPRKPAETPVAESTTEEA